MTRERREEVILVALVVSVAIHIGVMLMVRSQVMARPTVATRPRRPAPMRVVKNVPRPDPVKIEEILDEKAVKDAPAVREDGSVPQTEAPSDAMKTVQAPDVADLSAPPAPTVATPVFEVKPTGADGASAAAIPLVRIETPNAVRADDRAPDFTVRMPGTGARMTPPVAAVRTDPGPAALPVVKFGPPETATKPDYKPAREVFEKVDEQVVAEEKQAVRELVDSQQAADLVRFANVTMTATTADGWRYFRVMVTPRAALPVVPKDVVLILDGSGSIGNDRLGSCRAAARRILRTCTNSGDRFNLVVFRNAYSYAFRSWQECNAESFAAGDKWLTSQTAHGRTDVFSTIRSVLTLPRDPKRPLIALVITDGDANTGVSDTAEILSKFTALNDGLVAVYMYGVKSAANRELIDVLTHGNRGESFIFEGRRWNAGDGIEALSERFRDPVLSDLRVIFASGTLPEAYPRRLRNLFRGDTLSFYGRVPASARDVAFSLRGLGGADAYEGFFRLPFLAAPEDPSVVESWKAEAALDRKLNAR